MDGHLPRGRLTATILARGPREPLERTIRGLASQVDEILVGLCDPHDTWVPPGRAGQVQVARLPWADDLAAAKNALLATARGNWILDLEPGETLSADTAASLQRYLDRDAAVGQAFSLLVRVPRAAGSLAPEQIRQVRLWSRKAPLRYEGRVRPSLHESLVRENRAAVPLPWHLDRGPEEHEPAQRARRARSELDLARRELSELGQVPRVLLALAQALHALGDSQGAASRFAEVLSLATATACERLEAWYGQIAVGEAENRLPAQQIALCVQALEDFPLDAQLLCALGGATQSSGRVDLAARAYHAAWQFGQIDEFNWHLLDVGSLAAICCSLAQQVHGNEAAAVATAREALARRPASTQLAWHLVDLLLRQGEPDAAWQAFEQASVLSQAGHRDALRQAFAGAALVRARDWAGARRHLEAAFLQGCRAPICLRWLALVLGQLSDYEAQLPVLLAWREAEPDSPEVERQLRALGRAEPVSGATENHSSSGQVRFDAPQLAPAGPIWSALPVGGSVRTP